MKKAKIISIVVLTFVFSLIASSLYCAEFKMTEEELEKSFQECFEELKEEASNVRGTITAEVQENKILIKTNIEEIEEIIEIYYDFTDSCKFYFDVTVLKDTKIEEVILSPMDIDIAFIPIAKNKGVKSEYALIYILSKTFESYIPNIDTEEVEDLDKLNPVQHMKLIFEKFKPVDDELFSLNAKKIEESEEKITLRYELIVKTDADFSIINEESMKDEAKNFLSELFSLVDMENTVPEFIENIKTQYGKGENVEFEDTTEEKVDDTTEKKEELPKAGKDIHTMNILKTIIIFAVSIFAVMLALDLKKHKQGENS